MSTPDPGPDDSSSGRSIGTSVLDVSRRLNHLVRGEIRLAKAEVRQTVDELTRQCLRAASFGLLAALGVMPLVAFLVLGLGHLLGDNYWLSSLLVGLAFVILGVAFGAPAAIRISRIRRGRGVLAHTRQSVAREFHLASRKIQEATEAPDDDESERRSA